MENDKAMIADLHGWKGSEQTGEADAANGGGTYTARLYSNVGATPEGDPFRTQYSANFADGTLDEATTEGTAGRVASPQFDQSAGVKEFEQPENTVAVLIAGSYHGVSGTYSCIPGDGNTCAVQVAASGFTLGVTADATNAFTSAGGTWTFDPDNPADRVMGNADMIYATYGWWIHEAADASATRVSAFAVNRGAVSAAAIGTLEGTATYKGGAAGKYAILAGPNTDAGHFTADAELNVDFSGTAADRDISGTIDNFMGADGMPRDWSVELRSSGLGDDGDTPDVSTGTIWTIDGTAASSAGAWHATLYNNNARGVPAVGTGTFESDYGNIGRMVGAFGVNLEE